MCSPCHRNDVVSTAYSPAGAGAVAHCTSAVTEALVAEHTLCMAGICYVLFQQLFIPLGGRLCCTLPANVGPLLAVMIGFRP
jgi:hypothetical protein